MSAINIHHTYTTQDLYDALHDVCIVLCNMVGVLEYRIKQLEKSDKANSDAAYRQSVYENGMTYP